MDGWAVVGPGRGGGGRVTRGQDGQVARARAGGPHQHRCGGASRCRRPPQRARVEADGACAARDPSPPPGHDVAPSRGGGPDRGDRAGGGHGAHPTRDRSGRGRRSRHGSPSIPAPRVALAVLGDELTTSGVPTGGGVRDALCAPAARVGVGDGRRPGRPAARTRPARRDPRGAECSVDADVVVTTGGTARGPADHVRAAVADLGGTWHVDGVQVRPGHPMKLGDLPEGRLLVALPGNPLAAVSGLADPGRSRSRRARGSDAAGPAPGPADAAVDRSPHRAPPDPRSLARRRRRALDPSWSGDALRRLDGRPDGRGPARHRGAAVRVPRSRSWPCRGRHRPAADRTSRARVGAGHGRSTARRARSAAGAGRRSP